MARKQLSLMEPISAPERLVYTWELKHWTQGRGLLFETSEVISMPRLTLVMATYLTMAVVIMSCDLSPDKPSPARPVTSELPQAQSVSPPSMTTPDPIHTAPPTPLPLTIVATTTDPLYTSAAELDYSPDGSAGDRAKIVAHSTLIVIGTVADADPKVERIPGRLSGDPSRPDPNWTTVAYVHDIMVERYLKGSGPDAIPVLLPWGHEEIVLGAAHAPGVLVQTSYSAHHLYLEKGGRYLLFLTESDHVPGLWTGTAEPYRYLLSEGRGRVRTPAGNPGRPFYTRGSEQDLIDRVKDVIDYQSSVANSGIPHRERWKLESLDGSLILEDRSLRLTVNGNGYGGYDGCNSFGGGHEGSQPVASKDRAFSAPPGMTTLKLCVSRDGSESIMDQADAYTRAIYEGETFRIDGDRLKILDGNGEVRLVFVKRPDLPGEAVDLSGTQWRLLDENDEYGDHSLPTLVFLNEHMVGGATACHSYVADYGSRFRGNLDFEQRRTVGSEDSCTEEMVDLERGFLQRLSISTEYTVDTSSGESILRMRKHWEEPILFEPLPQADEDRIFTERWSLEGFTKPDEIHSWHTVYSDGTDVIPGTKVTVSFLEKSLVGTGECYSFAGSLDIEGSMVEVGDVLRTEKPCENVDGMRGQDIRFADVMERVTLFQVYGDRLFMQSENDEALLFRAE